MTTAAIRNKLYDYIRIAGDKKVKAIYTMLEEEIEQKYDYWNDKDFVAELNRQSADFKNGKVKGITWADAKAQVTRSVKKKTK
jgi:hypothetical protein